MCRLTYLGPSKQMRANGQLWEAGVAHELPRNLAERFMSRYPFAEWSLEVEEVVSEPEVKAPVSRTRKAKVQKPEPETEEPVSELEDPTSESANVDGLGVALDEEE